MKEYKLFNTDGKTFFDFRSEPDSRCEGFTLTYCDNGTVVMSGDYGTLCWQRNWHSATEKDFQRDYGFPNKETGIGYFAEKVCQFGIPQQIEEWNKEKAIADLKEFAKSYELENDEKMKSLIEETEGLEEWNEDGFYEIRNQYDDWDMWESKIGIRYTEQFIFMFKILQSVSEQIWEVINNQDKKNEREQLEFCGILDTWYNECKGQFTGTHPLGMRKEDLKSQVCKWIEEKKFDKSK